MKTITKKRFWFQELPEHSRLCLYSNLLLLPGIITLILYGMTNRIWNILLVYLLVDSVIFLASRRNARHQLRKEEEERLLEVSGEGFALLKAKIHELKELEK